MARARKKQRGPKPLTKVPTGIAGLDEITGGGFPESRTTLLTGGPGCGKTLLAMQFIVNGIRQFNEPGAYLAFEETPEELEANMASLGFPIRELVASGKLFVDHVHVDRSEIEHAGSYDLDGLMIRLQAAIDSVKAKRVALDTIEVLFSGLPDPLTVRAELRRLFRWLKHRNLTTVATGERSETTLTRHCLEEFVSDCVVALEHRTRNEISTRHLQVVKYRGSTHGTNSYPFLIDENGISVTPITSLALNHAAPTDRVSTGIPALDRMLGGKGVYRGSSTLVSGTAGAGKTSIAASFVNAACRRRERALYYAYEESENQIIRNMRSIGMDLAPWISKKLLRFHAVRPTFYGLEMHLVQLHKLVQEFKPSVVVVDPISNLTAIGTPEEANSMVRRLVDYLKMEGITAMFTDLTSNPSLVIETEIGVSSLMDAWLLLRQFERQGERQRGITVLKARGTDHSRRNLEVVMSDGGIDIKDADPAVKGSGAV
jgi:circadian clock protein KaiC